VGRPTSPTPTQVLYASERTISTLAGVQRRSQTGMLTTIDPIQPKSSRRLNIDRRRYLLSVGQLSNSMTSYAIDKRPASSPR